jgi:hypothetical protein
MEATTTTRTMHGVCVCVCLLACFGKFVFLIQRRCRANPATVLLEALSPPPPPSGQASYLLPVLPLLDLWRLQEPRRKGLVTVAFRCPPSPCGPPRRAPDGGLAMMVCPGGGQSGLALRSLAKVGATRCFGDLPGQGMARRGPERACVRGAI